MIKGGQGRAPEEVIETSLFLWWMFVGGICWLVIFWLTGVIG